MTEPKQTTPEAFKETREDRSGALLGQTALLGQNPADVPLDEKLLWQEIPQEELEEILDNLALQKSLGYYDQ